MDHGKSIQKSERWTEHVTLETRSASRCRGQLGESTLAFGNAGLNTELCVQSAHFLKQRTPFIFAKPYLRHRGSAQCVRKLELAGFVASAIDRDCFVVQRLGKLRLIHIDPEVCDMTYRMRVPKRRPVCAIDVRCLFVELNRLLEAALIAHGLTQGRHCASEVHARPAPLTYSDCFSGKTLS